MRYLVVLIMTFPFAAEPIFAQTENPDEQSIVNKKYDENGNLIQYDSTYIHQWSSDSTFNFPLDGNLDFGEGFADMNSLLQEFFGDSVNSGIGINHHFQFPPFDDEDFLNQFPPSLHDSLFNGHSPLKNDSLMSHYFGLKGNLPNEFQVPDMEEFRKHIMEQLDKNKLNFPEFKSPEQQDEWEKLVKKHQAEKEELMKKWEEKK